MGEGKKKTDWIMIIPPLVLLVAVGTLTKYNLVYTALAVGVGYVIGLGLKKWFKK